MLGVDQRHDGVEAHLLADRAVGEEGGCDWSRISKAARFDDDALEAVFPREELAQDFDKIVAHVNEAADAAVTHLVDFFFGGQNEIRNRHRSRQIHSR